MGLLNTITETDLKVLEAKLDDSVDGVWDVGETVQFAVTSVVELDKENRKGLLINAKALNTDQEGASKTFFLAEDRASMPMFVQQNDMKLLTILYPADSIINKTATPVDAIGKKFTGLAGKQRHVGERIYQNFARFQALDGITVGVVTGTGKTARY